MINWRGDVASFDCTVSVVVRCTPRLWARMVALLFSHQFIRISFMTRFRVSHLDLANYLS